MSDMLYCSDAIMGKYRNMKPAHNSQTSGFTLVELSVVIVIIGLIIAAVVAGKELIRNAQLQSIIKDAQGYQAAIRAFQLRYKAFPGDMDDATDYWPGETTNGNGDGRITYNTWVESLPAWQQLSFVTLDSW